MAYTFWTRAPRIVRGVSVAGVSVSGLTVKEAKKKLLETLPPPAVETISIEYEDRRWATSAAALGIHRDYDGALAKAIQQGRRSNILAQQSLERAQLLAQPSNLDLPWKLSETEVRSWVSAIATELAITGRSPSAKVTASTFLIDPGQFGQQLNQEQLVADILTHPEQPTAFSAPVEPTVIPLSADGQIRAESRLKRLRPAKIILSVGNDEPKITLAAADFFPWIILPDGWQREKISTYVDQLATRLDQEVVNAEFERDPANNQKLKKFQPQRDGRALKRDELIQSLIETFNKIESGGSETSQELPVPFTVLSAQVTLESLNNLGIKEPIGVGHSTFFHSIPNRVANVALTSQRLNAALIAPGEDFSFNRVVGEISSRTGYKPAYVISGGRTVLGDGGGVCQVSTTTFRAALAAGLPISKWKPHSYRVGYYEQNTQPGFDATVYSPSTDLSFRNDTGHYLVIATKIDVENRYLTIEIWGTSDGRKAVISEYSLTNQTGAPAPAYLPDSTLPRGTTRQIDFAAPGATAQFTYTVTDKNGQTTFSRKFVSRFQAWRAVFLVGTL